MDIEKSNLAYCVVELAEELDCSPYELVDNIAGMLISDEEASQIKDIISKSTWN